MPAPGAVRLELQKEDLLCVTLGLGEGNRSKDWRTWVSVVEDKAKAARRHYGCRNYGTCALTEVDLWGGDVTLQLAREESVHPAR